MDLEKYNQDFEAFQKFQKTKNLDYYSNPSKYYIKPFKIAGNLYYIGDQKVCSHLVDTGEGLIMFDCGFPHAAHLLIQAIWELGFNPSDIKYLIISHEHEDHYGAIEEFKRLYGCKTVLSKAGANVFRTRNDSVFSEDFKKDFPHMNCTFVPDIELEDEDIISLGNTKIRCVSTPGHSEGVMSFFFEIFEKNKAYNVGYFGGAGFNTLFKDILLLQNRPVSVREEFLNSFKKVREEKVDIVLGNHPRQNETLEKREKMIANNSENPFINPTEWQKFCDTMTSEFIKFMERDK